MNSVYNINRGRGREGGGGGEGGRVFHSKSTGIIPKITFSLLQYLLSHFPSDCYKYIAIYDRYCPLN
jgi:hypothetical protein